MWDLELVWNTPHQTNSFYLRSLITKTSLHFILKHFLVYRGYSSYCASNERRNILWLTSIKVSQFFDRIFIPLKLVLFFFSTYSKSTKLSYFNGLQNTLYCLRKSYPIRHTTLQFSFFLFFNVFLVWKNLWIKSTLNKDKKCLEWGDLIYQRQSIWNSLWSCQTEVLY